jgi:cytochrome c
MLFRPLIGGIALSPITTSAAFAADGATVYKAQCAKCHGDTGKSDTTMGKAMKVPARRRCQHPAMAKRCSSAHQREPQASADHQVAER